MKNHDKHIMHIQVCAKLPHPEKSEQLSEIWAGKEHQVWRIVQLGCKIGRSSEGLIGYEMSDLLLVILGRYSHVFLSDCWTFFPKE